MLNVNACAFAEQTKFTLLAMFGNSRLFLYADRKNIYSVVEAKALKEVTDEVAPECPNDGDFIIFNVMDEKGKDFGDAKLVITMLVTQVNLFGAPHKAFLPALEPIPFTSPVV